MQPDKDFDYVDFAKHEARAGATYGKLRSRDALDTMPAAYRNAVDGFLGRTYRRPKRLG